MKIIINLVLAAILSACSVAAVLNVPGTYPTIQAGVDAAVNGDTVLVADGTYTGVGNVNVDPAGRNIVIKSANGPDDCIIDCEFGNRGFYIHRGETAQCQIIGFTVYQGYCSMGGGINITNSSPTIKNCILADCQTPTYGGGFHISNSSSVIQNCVIHNCHANMGGGVNSEGSNITLNSCVIAANSSSS